MISIRRLYAITFCLLLIPCAFINALAQDRGKLTGNVIDEETGEGVPAAQLLLHGTPFQTRSLEDGRFLLIAVPVATYDIEITAEGYASRLINNVQVNLDQTRTLNVSLSRGNAQIEQPASLSSSADYTNRNIAYRKDLLAYPGFHYNEFTRSLPGVVAYHGQQARYARGGRAGDLGYYLDGLKIENGAALPLPRSAIEQLSLQQTPANARYGDFLSGALHITTRTNTSRPFVAVEGLTSEHLDPYGFNTITGAAGAPLFKNRLHLFAAGAYAMQFDSAPSSVGQLQLAPGILDSLRAYPMALRALDDAGDLTVLPLSATLTEGATMTVDDEGVPVLTNGRITFSDGTTVDARGLDPGRIRFTPVPHADFLSSDAFQRGQAQAGRSSENLFLVGNIAVDLLQHTRLRIGGSIDRGTRDEFNDTSNRRILFAPEMTRKTDHETLILNAGLTQRFSSRVVLQLEADYRKSLQEFYDPRMGKSGDDLLRYGDIDDPIFSVLRSYKDARFDEEIRIDDHGTPDDPSDDEMLLVPVPYYINTYGDGLAPASTDEVIGGLVQIPGGRFNDFAQSQQELYRAAGYLSAQIGIHELEIGAAIEQLVKRYWQINAQELAGFVADGSPERIPDGFDPLDSEGYATYDALPDFVIDGAVETYYGYDVRGERTVDDEDFAGFLDQSLTKPLSAYNIKPYAPRKYAGYLQDKIEWGSLTLDVGLRAELFDNNARVIIDPYTLRPSCRVSDIGSVINGISCGSGTPPSFVEEDYVVFFQDDRIVGFRDLHGNYYDEEGQPAERVEITLYRGGQVRRTSPTITEDMYTNYSPQLTLLPRLAFSILLIDRLQLHGSYATFSRAPTRFGYASLDDLSSTSGLANNVQQEKSRHTNLGITHSIPSLGRISLSGYSRKFRNLISTSSLVNPQSLTYELHTLGIETTMQINGPGGFSTQINYTLSKTEQVGGDPPLSIALISTGPLAALRIPPSFDQRHRFNATLSYGLARNEGPEVFGMHPLENTRVTLHIYAGSGFPYTPVSEVYSLAESRAPRIAGSFNGLRMPGSAQIDLQLSRRVEHSGATVFLQVQNLFDRTNINQVWPFTGQHDVDGFLASDTGQRILADNPSFESLYEYRSQMPSWTGIPRLIRLGLRAEF